MRKAFFTVTLLAVFALPCAWGQANSAARRTPLGTPTPFPIQQLADAQKNKHKPATPAPLEPVAQVLDRAAIAHGGRQNLKSVADSVSEGTFTTYTATGDKQAYPLTVLGKGDGKLQRIIKQPGGELRQGLDGTDTWDGFAGHHTAVRGPTLSFLEAQTLRSVSKFFDYQARGARMRDGGMKEQNRVVEIEETNGRTTTYFLDPSGRVAKMEFIVGQERNMLTGKLMPIVESYEFFDYRNVQGVLAPFTIGHLRNGLKLDVTELTSVRHNTGVANDVFRP